MAGREEGGRHASREPNGSAPLPRPASGPPHDRFRGKGARGAAPLCPPLYGERGGREDFRAGRRREGGGRRPRGCRGREMVPGQAAPSGPGSPPQGSGAAEGVSAGKKRAFARRRVSRWRAPEPGARGWRRQRERPRWGRGEGCGLRLCGRAGGGPRGRPPGPGGCRAAAGALVASGASGSFQAFSLFVKAREVPAAARCPAGGEGVRWRCCRQAFEELSGIHRHVALQHAGDIGQQAGLAAKQAAAEGSPASGPAPASKAEGPHGHSRGSPEICCALPDTSHVSYDELTR